MFKRVSITGPESTGKSSLAKYLAGYFGEPFVPEYAREYLSGKGLKYDMDDVLKIAKGQLKAENTIAREANKILFCDTDLLVTKIWCEVVFGTVPQWIEKNFLEHKYDLYMLCYPDIEWQPDPLRQNPSDRLRLFSLYEKTLRKHGLTYEIITGTGTKRYEKAVNIIKRILQ